MRDLPGWMAELPGLSKKTQGGKEVVSISPIWKRVYDIAGAGRAVSEVGRFNRLKKSLESGESERIIGSLADVLLGVRTREGNLPEMQDRQIMDRIFGMSHVQQVAQRENRK